MKALFGGVFATVALALVLSGTQADGQEQPKYKIKEVMKEAMAGKLCAKVAGGMASQQEKDKLVVLFTALHANTPPKGAAESWKTRTKALLDAAKAGDGDALKKAADCKSCHMEFKGK